MFEGNTGINQPIGAWDTSSVTDIRNMFFKATAFEQDLSNWVVTGVTSAGNFMRDITLSTTNYDRTLSGWSSQAVQSGVNIHFGNSQYSTATGLAYRNALVASGWTITDGGAL
jgi:surface protein